MYCLKVAGCYEYACMQDGRLIRLDDSASHFLSVPGQFQQFEIRERQYDGRSMPCFPLGTKNFLTQGIKTYRQWTYTSETGVKNYH